MPRPPEDLPNPDDFFQLNNSFPSHVMRAWDSQTTHTPQEAKTLTSGNKRWLPPVEPEDKIDPEEATKRHVDAYFHQPQMMQLCGNAVLVDDQDGKQHADVPIRWAPAADAVVDTSSSLLSQPLLYNDDSDVTGYVRALGINPTYVVKTGIMDVAQVLVNLLEQSVQ
jgi:hypothetical protein